VCGNKKCEGPYETCTNCTEDCGACETTGCLDVLTCIIGKCISSGVGGLPSPTCVANCVSLGCPAVQFFVDQAFACVVKNFSKCSGGGATIDCFRKVCDKEIAACIGAKCK